MVDILAFNVASPGRADGCCNMGTALEKCMVKPSTGGNWYCTNMVYHTICFVVWGIFFAYGVALLYMFQSANVSFFKNQSATWFICGYSSRPLCSDSDSLVKEFKFFFLQRQERQ